jgi:hypothetical protein
MWLVATMPVRFAWRAATGRARPGEGRRVAGLFALACATVGALLLEGVLIAWLFRAARDAGGPVAASLPKSEVTSAYVAPIALGGVTCLALLVAAVQVLRLFVRPRPTPRVTTGAAEPTAGA